MGCLMPGYAPKQHSRRTSPLCGREGSSCSINVMYYCYSCCFIMGCRQLWWWTDPNSEPPNCTEAAAVCPWQQWRVAAGGTPGVGT